MKQIAIMTTLMAFVLAGKVYKDSNINNYALVDDNIEALTNNSDFGYRGEETYHGPITDKPVVGYRMTDIIIPAPYLGCKYYTSPYPYPQYGQSRVIRCCVLFNTAAACPAWDQDSEC